MGREVSYKSTIVACYIGNITMAAITNFLPIIFITLRGRFGLSFSQLGALTFINFITQVTVDFSVGPLVDKYGFRRFILASAILTVTGFTLFASAPWIADRPYPLFIAATVIFSGSCGLLELLLSPIVNSVPTEEKTKALSMLHAFYCWGVIFVVLVSTVALRLLGSDRWQFVMLLWIIVPIIDFFMFLKVPLAPPVPEEKRQGFSQLCNKKIFLLLCFAILCGAASELAVAQWASAFVEKGLGVSKLFGDIVGVCGFALMMGVGRVILGKKGGSEKIDLNIVLMVCFAMSAVFYVVAALSGSSAVSLIACAVTGLSVSTLWPGMLVAATRVYPLAGAWMFAVMSGFGDTGGAAAPWLAGKIADAVQVMPAALEYCSASGTDIEQLGLKSGLLISAVFPVIGFFIMLSVINECKIYKNSRQRSKKVVQ
jgi:fucose permease